MSAHSCPDPAENSRLLELLVESVKDYAIFLLSPSGHVRSWNRGAQRLKGYAAAEAIGRHFSMFYSRADVLEGKPERKLREAAAEGRAEDEGWRVRKDGTRFWASVVITALRDEAGDLVAFGKVTRDLTERRAAEARAIADARQLAEAEALGSAKSEFLAALSHELRTPLNAIGGYTDLLQLGIRGPLTDAQHEDLSRIKRSQQHLLGIVNDLLNFTRVEAGRVNYEIASVRVAELVEGVRPLIEPMADAKGVGLDCRPGDRPDDREVRASCDALKVEQILLNLLTNAVKYTGPGGHVEVGYERSGSEVVVHVRDDGIGIPPERVEDIFEPFVQVGRSLTASQEGAGLGLSISRELARAMGGDLTATSTVGAGSDFTLTLPADPRL